MDLPLEWGHGVEPSANETFRLRKWLSNWAAAGEPVLWTTRDKANGAARSAFQAKFGLPPVAEEQVQKDLGGEIKSHAKIFTERRHQVAGTGQDDEVVIPAEVGRIIAEGLVRLCDGNG